MPQDGVTLKGQPPQRTFVLADLLNPGQRVHLHQRVRDTDHVHHVHDALKAGHWAVSGGGLHVGLTPLPGAPWWEGGDHMGISLGMIL